MKLDAILFQIDEGHLVLPTFQRSYVWNREQVRSLMRSLYRNYPVGNFLVWETKSETAVAKGAMGLNGPAHSLLLDGQQRITSLYGIIRGKRPKFSDADERSFLNLYFDVVEQDFEFYRASKMKDKPHWIPVTELMQKDIGPFFPRFSEDPNQTEFINRLIAVRSITGRDFHVETVRDNIASDSEKVIDVVVDIFNEVNSGGRKLSKGDLALAKISAYWPEARETMQGHFDKWQSEGYRINDYQYKFDWLLRCVNAVLTGHSDFAELDRHDFTASDIQDGLKRAKKYIYSALGLFEWRLGLDHREVLGSPNALPAVIRLFDKPNSTLDEKERDRFLYWFVHAMLWGRYSGPVETVIRQDLMTIDENEQAVDALIERLEQDRGSLEVTPQNFADWSRGSRFYPLLYMLTRVSGTRDLGEGIGLKVGIKGEDYQLQLHHIFPKAQLYKSGYARKEVNALANFTILFRKTNYKLSDSLPQEYFQACESNFPGVLKSHWIPEDPELWKIENYRDFLADRRERLARAANDFLEQLKHGTMPDAEVPSSMFDKEARPRPISVASVEEEAALNEAMDWMETNGLPRGEYGFELVSSDSELLTTLDLAWPRGIQEGMTRQAALLINESEETRNIAEDHDFKCFTSLAGLKLYVREEILGEREPV